MTESLNRAPAGEAIKVRYPSGSLQAEFWSQDGRGQTLHRKDAPAKIVYGTDGRIILEEWWWNGFRHREDGPQRTEYDYNGNVIEYGWMINGGDTYCSFDDWLIYNKIFDKAKVVELKLKYSTPS